MRSVCFVLQALEEGFLSPFFSSSYVNDHRKDDREMMLLLLPSRLWCESGVIFAHCVLHNLYEALKCVHSFRAQPSTDDARFFIGPFLLARFYFYNEFSHTHLVSGEVMETGAQQVSSAFGVASLEKACTGGTFLAVNFWEKCSPS